ncbi:unnamed protein product [Amoebophrya sp. A25]|nr:unnamed protein product [Amoebophrya sp. A25]|eukprot:GSA25T00022835001.1
MQQLPRPTRRTSMGHAGSSLLLFVCGLLPCLSSFCLGSFIRTFTDWKDLVSAFPGQTFEEIATGTTAISHFIRERSVAYD